MTSDRQLDLFADPEPSLDGQHAQTGLVDLATRLPAGLRFGTSSWTFPGWAGLVYARKYKNTQAFTRESLREYAGHPLMRSVGIDRGYYAPLNDADLAHYKEQLPADFPCVMKVWNEVTTRAFPKHARWGERAGEKNPNFLNADLFASSVVAPIERAFGGHVGSLVVEIPPSNVPISDAEFCERLELFLRNAPAGYAYAVELRERRLMTRGYADVLARTGATHAFNYWGRMPDLGAQRAWFGDITRGPVVVRLLLPPGRRYDEMKKAYAPFDRIVELQRKMRTDTVALIREALDRDLEVFVIVNNKAEGSSPLTVEALARMVVG